MNFIITNIQLIQLSQTQIGENADNLNNAESYILAGNYRQLTILVRTETSQRILTNKFNITYYKQNVGTNNEFCCFC